MTSKKIIEGALIRLAEHWPKKITEKLIDNYYRLLKYYSDDEIIDATFKYLDSENDKFPPPGIFKKFIPIKNYEGIDSIKFHLTEYKMRCQSPGCLKKDLCIREPNELGVPYICRDCYTGLSFQERQGRLRDIMHMIKDKNFKPKWVASSHEN